MAQPPVIAVSQAKYRVQPAARARPMVCPGLPCCGAVNIDPSCWFSVMLLSASRGRTGPRNRTVVGSRCPNRSSSPGPEALSVSAAPPTRTVWPATDTGCIGVTTRATVIDAKARDTAATR